MSRLILTVLLLAVVLPAQAAAQGRLVTFERDELAIQSDATGERHDFEVELAVTFAQQAQGLMYRRSLPRDAGMLFLYKTAGPASMWMRNTLIPLDMLFIERDGRIAHIAQRTVPLSLTSIESPVPVVAVLELNAGTTHRLGIRVGDRVLHPAFDPPS